VSQPITDDTLARWERMYSFTHPGDLEGERIRSLLVHIQALTAEREGLKARVAELDAAPSDATDILCRLYGCQRMAACTDTAYPG
jgi:hypothetical protein